MILRSTNSSSVSGLTDVKYIHSPGGVSRFGVLNSAFANTASAASSKSTIRLSRRSFKFLLENNKSPQRTVLIVLPFPCPRKAITCFYFIVRSLTSSSLIELADKNRPSKKFFIRKLKASHQINANPCNTHMGCVMRQCHAHSRRTAKTLSPRPWPNGKASRLPYPIQWVYCPRKEVL